MAGRTGAGASLAARRVGAYVLKPSPWCVFTLGCIPAIACSRARAAASRTSCWWRSCRWAVKSIPGGLVWNGFVHLVLNTVNRIDHDSTSWRGRLWLSAWHGRAQKQRKKRLTDPPRMSQILTDQYHTL